MTRLLIVAHVPSPNMQALTDAVRAGAADPAAGEATVRYASALEASAEDVLKANGVILGTTENFGYMSGGLKYFLDNIYYPCLGKTEGMPYALFVKGGQDGTGAQASVERILKGLRWRAVQEPLVMAGTFREEWLDSCRGLGLTMAAGLDAGIF